MAGHTDPLLQRLTRIVEQQQVYLPITLYIDGRPVSGVMTSAADFHDRAREDLQDIAGDDPSDTVTETIGLLRAAFDQDAADPESDYIYLTDVFLLGERTLDLSTTVPSPCLRFHLSAVDAFHLMSLSTGEPFEEELDTDQRA